jgi:hypothetical protein
MSLAAALWAQSTSAGTTVDNLRSTFELGRVLSWGPLEWALLALGVLVVGTLVVVFYLRDCAELGGAIAAVLITLRMLAFVGLLWVFLEPQIRDERDVVTNSRVLMLVDTSQSMGISDEESQGRRIDEWIAVLEQGDLLSRLRQTHDVSVLKFDTTTEVVTSALYKFRQEEQQRQALAAAAESRRQREPASLTLFERLWPFVVPAVMVVIALLCLWLVADFSFAVRLGGSAVALLLGAALAWYWLVQQQKYDDATALRGQRSLFATPQSPEGEQAPLAIDWRQALNPVGSETRLGEALRRVLDEERGRPLAGIILVTDGRNNAGVSPESVIRSLTAQRDQRPAAAEQVPPLYVIGLGTVRNITAVRVADVEAPPRAFAGDAYLLRAHIESFGLSNTPVTVELLRRKPGEPPEAAQQVATVTETLSQDGQIVVVPFKLGPEDQPGTIVYTVRVRPPSSNIRPTPDMQHDKQVEIVDQKTRVLLLAGGPSREYQFLRNQLKRDPTMIVHVLLQTARPGISQDADRILDDFPRDRRELFGDGTADNPGYDCIVCFDPDWRRLSPEQITLLEEWVSSEAGGLIVIPGPVHTDTWAQSQREGMDKLRALYPVEFHRHFTLLENSKFDRDEAFPIRFVDENNDRASRDGPSAEFLWLGDNEPQSSAAWKSFRGVYGYYPVKGAKPLATVHARFGDPSSDPEQGGVVYMCSQFYGAGRVFYLGSGEMYRIRAVDEAYFETFYTKLIRHVSQGRLLRGTSRGRLDVKGDRFPLGSTVAVVAQLKNERLEPLQADKVILKLYFPDDRTVRDVELAAQPDRPGSFAGQFGVYQQGTYKLLLEIPGAEGSERFLSRSIDVRLPDRERENTQRNDPLLTQLATATRGHYYTSVTEATTADSPQDVVRKLPDAQRVKPMSDQPRPLWDNQWTLFAICGALCLEWLIRRLSKLA